MLYNHSEEMYNAFNKDNLHLLLDHQLYTSVSDFQNSSLTLQIGKS